MRTGSEGDTMPSHPTILKANHLRQTNPAKACRMVEKFVLRVPTAGSFGAFDLLGQIYLKAGHPVSARSAFHKEFGYERDAIPDNTWNYLGLINYVIGDKDAEPKFSEYVVCSLFEGQYVEAVVSACKDRASGRGVEIDRIKILESGELPPALFRAWWQFWKR
jgi:hypothetical protein